MNEHAMANIKTIAVKAWKFIRQKKSDLYTIFTRKKKLTPELTEAMLKLQEEKYKQNREQDLAKAQAAAASGEGPQPWERDWIETQWCIEDDIRDIADRIGWHRSQDLLEVLDWAMASPQGQRALALDGDPNSPWQDVLTMIQELRRPLLEASHKHEEMAMIIGYFLFREVACCRSGV